MRWASSAWLSYVRDSRSPEKSELLRWIVQFPLFVGALQSPCSHGPAGTAVARRAG